VQNCMVTCFRAQDMKRQFSAEAPSAAASWTKVSFALQRQYTSTASSGRMTGELERVVAEHLQRDCGIVTR
jgi:hypothetical protein